MWASYSILSYGLVISSFTLLVFHTWDRKYRISQKDYCCTKALLRLHGKHSCQVLYYEDGRDQRKGTPTFTYRSPYHCEIFSYWLFQAATDTISLKTTKRISKYFIEAAALKSQHLVTSRTMTDKWDAVRPNCIASCVVPQNCHLQGNTRFKTSEGKTHVKTRLWVKPQGLEKEASETCWWNGERVFLESWCISNATLNLTVISLQEH